MDSASAPSSILARLRAVAASPSAQSGRLPEGDVTASAAQLDTQSVSHAVAGRAVQPPVALEVAARVAALRQILTSDPGVSPADSDKGRAQPHYLESVAVSGPNPYATPSNGADRVPDMHQHSPDLGPGQAPPSHSTEVSSGRPSQAPSGGECSALPLLLTHPHQPRSHNRSRSGVGRPRRLSLGENRRLGVFTWEERVRWGMGSIPHPKEVCEHPNSHAERKLRDRWDVGRCIAALFHRRDRRYPLCEIAAKEFRLPPSHPRVQGYACTKIYIGRRASLASRVNAARLALEDLARFEGSDPQLSLFRRRLDGTFAIAGAARLGAAQQAAVEINPSGVAVSRFPTAAGFLSSDLGLGLDCVHYLSPNNRVGGKG
eukprot:scaffold752_cov153-Isochrysis_galbana.AAC.1